MKRFSVLAACVLVVCFFGALVTSCTDSATSEGNYVRVRITQPVTGAVVTDSLVRVLTDVVSNCGCSAVVDFYLDGEKMHFDALPQYSWDWHTSTTPEGVHVIVAHAIVYGKAEGRDSIRVEVRK